MGRPKLKDEEIRNIDVTVALNAKEFRQISARAKQTKKSIAAFLRYAGLGNESLKIVPPINEESAQYLRELQHLLTQFAVILEQQQIKSIDPIIFIEMQKELKRMHSDFLNYGNNQNNQR